MSEFEDRLHECLEALHEGRWDVDACLRHYPRHAAALRPHLVAADALMRAYAAEPDAAFAAAARERFLVASGQRLEEAYDLEPEPSFFAAARVRFLMAAHRMRAGEAKQPRRAAPALVRFTERHFRVLAGAAAALVLFLSFSTYTVASANSALPGDWRYGIKLRTEQVRLALAFSEGGKRGVKLDIVEERARELEELTKNGDTIDQGVLGRIVAQTAPLVQSADDGWDTEDVARLQEIASRERRALDQARPKVKPEAQDELAQAVDVSRKAVEVSSKIIVQRPSAPPEVVTPSELLTASSSAVTTPTPGASETPAAGATVTAGPGSETPAATPATSTAEPTFGVEPATALVRGGVTWRRLVVGRLSTLIPDEKDGWRYSFDVAAGTNPTPALVHLSNADGTSLITLNPRNGDVYWFIAHGGRFGEIQLRIQQADGTVLVVDRDYLLSVYGADDTAIPLYVLDNIDLQPTPTPTARPEPQDKIVPTP